MMKKIEDFFANVIGRLLAYLTVLTFAFVLIGIIVSVVFLIVKLAK